MANMIRPVYIIDDNGVKWKWDGEKLDVDGIEKELSGEELEESGYWCGTLEEVFDELVSGGYIFADLRE